MSVASSITPNATSTTSHHFNKFSNTLELFPFSFQTHFLKPNQLPKLTLNFKNHFCSSSLSLPSRSSLISTYSATFNGLELSQEDAQSTESTDEKEIDIGDVLDDDLEKVDESQSGGVTNDAGRLYVGNLPFAMTSSQLADIFKEAGTVTSVEIMYDRVTGRSRGFGFVIMGSEEEAKEAIRMFEGSQVGGREVKVNFPEVPMGDEKEILKAKMREGYKAFIDTPHKLYVGNISWTVTSQQLTEVFNDQPGFVSAKVIYERNSGRSRGFGFVTFDSAEASESALSTKNEVEVDGRPLRLYVAENRAPLVPS